MTNPFTTATATGVATRDLTVIIGSVVAVLGILGLLDAEQVAALTEQAPALFTAAGVLITGAMSAYRILTKSSSDKAHEVAKAVDAEVPADAPVVIKTPADVPDIVVPPKA